MSPPRLRAGVVLAVWAVPALLSTFQRWASASLSGQPAIGLRAATDDWPGWLLWALMTPAIFTVTERFPLERPRLLRDCIAHLGAWSACLLLHATVTSAIRMAVNATIDSSFSRSVGVAAISWLPSTVLLYAATVGVALLMRSIQREHARARESAAMSVQLSRAELAALRSQLHPHFLFNTLNTIAILIREHETQVSSRLVTQLGDVLRHVLHGSRGNETSLREEIAMLSTYLEIEQVRFGERLEVRWSMADDVLDAHVPSLVLQPLVENALRHGIANRTEWGVVEIGARNDNGVLLLWITDNGPGIDTTGTAANRLGGVGLANTRERLARLYPGRASLQLSAEPDGGTRAEVRLPLDESAA